MTLRRRATRGVVWSFAQRAGSQIASFAVFIFLSRLLAPESFGLFALATVYVSFGTVFIDQGFAQAIVQRKDLTEEQLDTAFWASVAGGVVMTGAAILFADLVADLYQEPELAPILRWTSLSLLFMASGSTQRAILRRKLDLGKLSIRTLIAELVGGVIGIILALRGFGVWSLVARNLFRDAIGLIMIWVISDWRPRASFSRAHYAELFRFGKSIIGSRLLTFANRNADKILIGLLLGTTALGFYSIASRVVRLMGRLIFESFSSVAFPAFSRIQNQAERIPGALYEGTRYAALIAFPAFIGASILADDLVLALFGAKWTPSIPVLRVLALTGVVQATFFLVGPLLLAIGAPGIRLGLSALRASVGIVAIIVAASSGLVAISAGLVVRDLLVFPVFLRAAAKATDLNLRRYLAQFRPAISGSLLMATALILAKSLFEFELPSVVSLLLYTTLGGVIYTAALRVLEPKASGEALQTARSLLRGQ